MHFVEKVVDSIVNSCGYCGNRGLSEKQFYILSGGLDIVKEGVVGQWRGHHAKISFHETIYDGFIGKYHVRLKHLSHFRNRYAVEMIESWIDTFPDRTQSEYQYEKKTRTDMKLMVIKEKHVLSEQGRFVHIYTFVDELNNCYVWFASKEQPFCVGDVCKLRATIRNHQEFKGIKQTVITRGRVLEVYNRQNVGLNGLMMKDRAYRDSLL